MATSKDFVSLVLTRLEPLDVTARPMFGEYGLYFRGKIFGGLHDDTLFIKVTEPGVKLAGKIATSSPYPGAKPAFKISPSKLKDRNWLLTLIEATVEALPEPKPRKRS